MKDNNIKENIAVTKIKYGVSQSFALGAVLFFYRCSLWAIS